MEALFSLDNTPGNVPDTGSNCFCFPDIRSQVMGLHVLPDEKRISSSKIKEKSLLFDSKKASELLFEPSSLHKYSSGMREMKLEYFFGENEDEPLVSMNILPFLGPNGSREGASHIGTSAISSSNSNYSLGHNNHSTSTGSVVGSSSGSYTNANINTNINSNINSNSSSASNISNTSSSHHGSSSSSAILANQYGSLHSSDVPHTPKRAAARSPSPSPSPPTKGGTEHSKSNNKSNSSSAAYSSGASEDSLGFDT